MLKPWLIGGALALGLIGSAAQAAPPTQPGSQMGLAYGPLPEGVYALNTFSWGRADAAGSPDIGVNIPVLVWATPYKILGAQVIPVLSFPSVFVNTNNAAPLSNQSQSYFYNPFVGSIFAFDLGSNVSAGWLVGAYLGLGDRGSLCNGGAVGTGCTPVLPQLASSALRNTFALSYAGNGWNLTAALTHEFMVNDAARFGGAVGASIGPVGQADSLNLDLTATKTFGKFEIGAVAYGYTDLPVNTRKAAYANFLNSGAAYSRTGMIAAGGLVGYDFGPFRAQFMVTRELANRARNEETRGWLRIIAPLYTPPASAAAAEARLVRKD
ncbi:transporter [Methylobacterium sp.]|uniref:transporter n=1 Tax=Methylobacterium sp. TaxID=409 RepID=UPI0025D74F0F|nr:transporter [Methylobacterium sp.]MBY0259747.1 transporter [Methylobacterium sp.]